MMQNLVQQGNYCGDKKTVSDFMPKENWRNAQDDTSIKNVMNVNNKHENNNNWRNAQDADTSIKIVKNTNNKSENNSCKGESISSPLIGYISEEDGGSADWESIEITNIETLLASSNYIKFFRIMIDRDNIKESLLSNGSLHIPYDIYQELKQCPSHYTTYLLLEESSELQWRSKHLVGIAKVCDLLFGRSKIRVNYLCLSKTEIEMDSCDEKNLTALQTVFTSYIGLLRSKSIKPLLAGIPPWSSSVVATLPTTMVSEKTADLAAQVLLDDLNYSIEKLGNISKRRKGTSDVNRLTENTYTEKDIQALTELYESNKHGVAVAPCATVLPPTVKSCMKSHDYHIKPVERQTNSNKVEAVDLTLDEDKDKHNGHRLPPLQGLFNRDKSLNTKPWQTIEYENLTQIADFTGQRFFMCDMELSTIHNSFGNGGLLIIKKELYDKIPDMQPNPSYLVLRKNNLSTEFKPVIGLAKVAYKIKNDIQVQVTYLCISRAQYVLNPWGEDDVFGDADEITYTEDVKILLDEYKMSARHKKVKPLFDYVYPWSGTPPVMNPQCSEKETLVNRSNSINTQRSDDLNNTRVSKNIAKGTNEENESKSQNVNRKLFADAVNRIVHGKELEDSNDEPFTHLDRKDKDIMTKMTLIRDSVDIPCPSPENQDKKRTRSSNSVNFSPVEQYIASENRDSSPSELEWVECNDNEFLVEESNGMSTWNGNIAKARDNGDAPLFTAIVNKANTPKQKNINGSRHNNSAVPTHQPTISSRNLAGTKISDKSKLPPLRGLFVNGTKTVSSMSWEEIERNNLAFISQPGNINEFFVCNTDTSTIRKSFREGYLEVSAKNMENISNLGRVRKLLILRAQLTNPNQFVVVGIAMVNPSAGVSRDEKGEKYVAKITYLCLSTFPGHIFGASQADGVEVFTHVSSGFIQQYMLALRQRTVRPLFSNIYPWNSPRIPKTESVKQQPRFIPVTSSSVKCDVPLPIKSNIDRLQESYADDLFAQHGTHLGEQTISFQQIDEELSQAVGEPIENEPISVPLKSHVKKEIVESRMKQYSSELSQIFKSDPRFSHDNRKRNVQKNLFNIPNKSANGVKKGPVPKTSRGRGRGMIILQMANTHSTEETVK